LRLRRYLEEKLIRGLRRTADRREFPLLAGAAAFCLTLTMTIPVSSALVVAAFLSPKRWPSIALYASLGGAVASTLLIVVFHDLGWEQLQERFPEMLETERWKRIIAWTREYGLTALLAVSVLPLPQTPALIIVSIGGPPGGSCPAGSVLRKTDQVRHGLWCDRAVSAAFRKAARKIPDSLSLADIGKKPKTKGLNHQDTRTPGYQDAKKARKRDSRFTCFLGALVVHAVFCSFYACASIPAVRKSIRSRLNVSPAPA
jgi:hypothetical protein